MQENFYAGREQSYIKHRFLTSYLKEAAYKTLQSPNRPPVFTFIDAFAGPWNVNDADDFSDSSFEQALRTLDGVKSKLEDMGKIKPYIGLILCEKSRESFEKLQRYVSNRQEYNIKIFHGAFEDRLKEIEKECKPGFTFTFIDPTGWNIKSDPVFSFLGKQRGEFLLNFMSEHINRHAQYPEVSRSFGRFLADPDWEESFKHTLPSEPSELRILQMLKERMKAARVATYLPDLEIQKPRQDRLKMRLVLGTHSPKGVEVFRDVQKHVEREEMAIREKLRRENKTPDQSSLFADEELALMEQGERGVGGRRAIEEIKAAIPYFLRREKKPTTFDRLATAMMEGHHVRATNVKDALVNLKGLGLVDYVLQGRQKKPDKDTIIRVLSS